MRNRALFVLAAAALAPTLAAQGAAEGVPRGNHRAIPHPCRDGHWEAPFDHDTSGWQAWLTRFEAIHMALIPKGPNRGRVIVWDAGGDQGPGGWQQRWSLVDVSVPDAPTFDNLFLSMPVGGGDLFCAAHAWTANGDLFVAGGTKEYPEPQLLDEGAFIGGILTYLYRPDQGASGTWDRRSDLHQGRWYPGMALLGNDQMLVLGGISNTDQIARNDYEAYDPATDTWQQVAGNRLIAGPQAPAGPLDAFARTHLLTSGELIVTGMTGRPSYMHHVAAPGVWTATGPTSLDYRSYGSSVLFPNQARDILFILGGEGYFGGQGLGTVASVDFSLTYAASPPDFDWYPTVPMKTPRLQPNVVVLPNQSVFVFGGRLNSWSEPVPEYTMRAEAFSLRNGGWKEMEPSESWRAYHATGVLLPDGRVLTAGADDRQWDYQVFVPPYLSCGWQRPVIFQAPTTMDFYGANPVTYTIRHNRMLQGHDVDKVVLMAPGSVTHHFDMSQRYLELAVIDADKTSVTVVAPLDSNTAPRGYYMLFLVSKLGIPSVAAWVRLQ